MDDFFPFVHNKKEKEPEYLYLELEDSRLYQNYRKKENEEEKIIIIDII